MNRRETAKQLSLSLSEDHETSREREREERGRRETFERLSTTTFQSYVEDPTKKFSGGAFLCLQTIRIMLTVHLLLAEAAAAQYVTLVLVAAPLTV